MKCDRCEANTKSKLKLFDYCGTCCANLCSSCMAKGCCGLVPACSGMDADDERADRETLKKLRETVPTKA